MSESPQAAPPSTATAPRTPRTVGRRAGLGVVATTALAVFTLGALVLPDTEPAPATAPGSDAGARAPALADPVVAPVSPSAAAAPPAAPAPAVAARADGAAAPETASLAAAVGVSAGAGASGANDRGSTSAAVDAAAPSAGGGTADGDANRADGASAKDRRGRSARGKAGEETAAARAASGADGGDSAGAAGSVLVERAKARLPPSDGTETGATDASAQGSENAADCTLPEKEMAREAWRRNWPTVCPLESGTKAAILIPIKGPIEGEVHEYRQPPAREARITLPSGSELLLTMKQYKMKRLGFKELRVSGTDKGGTRLKIKLQPGAGDPIFEVKDGYAKVTIATPGKD